MISTANNRETRTNAVNSSPRTQLSATGYKETTPAVNILGVVYLYVNGSGSITSVGEERANLSAVV